MCRKNYFILFSVLFMLLSCGSSRRKDEMNIEKRLAEIHLLISSSELNAAKIKLDSIHLLYPRLVGARRTAKALEDTIARRENLRTLAYCNDMLPQKRFQADSIQKNFRFEKNENYQNIGNFVHKTLNIESNTGRIYLRAYVDENADFFLISNFTGDYKLNHTCVKASAGDTYALTDSIPPDSPMNHQFSNAGIYWEIVSFKNEAAANVPVFIAQYAAERIKITLQGGSRSYSYYLTDTEKKALSETYSLWVAKKDVRMLEKEIQKANAIIERINLRYSEE